MIKGVKHAVDPQNIFATGNLVWWFIKMIVNSALAKLSLYLLGL